MSVLAKLKISLKFPSTPVRLTINTQPIQYSISFFKIPISIFVTHKVKRKRELASPNLTWNKKCFIFFHFHDGASRSISNYKYQSSTKWNIQEQRKHGSIGVQERRNGGVIAGGGRGGVATAMHAELLEMNIYRARKGGCGGGEGRVGGVGSRG